MARAPKPAGAKSASAASAARFLAVQALYQMEISGQSAEQTAGEFADYWAQTKFAEYALPPPDEGLLRAIVAGAAAEQKTLDERLGGLLKQDWSVARLDSILRALLRAAAWELLCRSPPAPRHVVATYTDMAHAFCDARLAGMANAILDRLARERP